MRVNTYKLCHAQQIAAFLEISCYFRFHYPLKSPSLLLVTVSLALLECKHHESRHFSLLNAGVLGSGTSLIVVVQ